MNTKRPLWLISMVGWVGVFLFASAVQARGAGIQAGGGRIHASMALDSTYDSNPNFAASGQEVADMMLKIRPGLNIDFPSRMFDFELGAKVGYDYYMGLEVKNTSEYSAIGGEANLNMGINPEGQVSLLIDDVFGRASDPINSTDGRKLERTNNEARARLQLKPGGGALSIDLGYGYAMSMYDDMKDYDGAANSSYAHRAYFGSNWRFLPKTAVTLDVDGELRRYPDRTQTQYTPNMHAVRAQLGLNGYVTSTLSVKLVGGFGDTMMESGDDFMSFIGKAEIAYNAKTTYVNGGYNRNFKASPSFGYFGQDRIFVSLRQTIAGQLSIFGEIGYDFLNFGRGRDNVLPERKDGMLGGKLALSYAINDWFDVGVAYNILSRTSETTGTSGSMNFAKHMASFHLGINY